MKKYVILHIATGREYDFTPEFWNTTNQKQIASGNIEWQFLREKIEPVIKAAIIAPPAQTKRGCNCGGKKN